MSTIGFPLILQSTSAFPLVFLCFLMWTIDCLLVLFIFRLATFDLPLVLTVFWKAVIDFPLVFLFVLSTAVIFSFGFHTFSDVEYSFCCGFLICLFGYLLNLHWFLCFFVKSESWFSCGVLSFSVVDLCLSLDVPMFSDVDYQFSFGFLDFPFGCLWFCIGFL